MLSNTLLILQLWSSNKKLAMATLHKSLRANGEEEK
jgi:hypothetical protein